MAKEKATASVLETETAKDLDSVMAPAAVTAMVSDLGSESASELVWVPV